jgi:hypothetical protein
MILVTWLPVKDTLLARSSICMLLNACSMQQKQSVSIRFCIAAQPALDDAASCTDFGHAKKQDSSLLAHPDVTTLTSSMPSLLRMRSVM